jgi:hypothetical protein
MARIATDADADAWRTQAWTTAAMALVFVAGFSAQLLAGRSSFAAPPVVHVHAIVFFGWVFLSVAQAWLAASGQRRWHRRLGWAGAGWMLTMLALGPAVTIAAVRTGRTPFFFQPQTFMFHDIATLLAFFALATTAIALRRDTGWHRRLHLCALAALMGPAVGRLLPMPLLGAHAFEVAAVPGLAFPAFLAWREWRHDGGLHPAWPLGIVLLPVLILGATGLARSATGAALYEAAVAGSPMEGRDGFAYPAPPGP